MNWTSPQYEGIRPGFEMPTAMKSSSTFKKLSLASLILTSSLISTGAFASENSNFDWGTADASCNKEASWKLHGGNRFNNANSTASSQITKANVNKLQLKWIYNIPIVPLGSPLNPYDNPRAENGVSNGVSVDEKGITYVSTFDGKIYKLDSLKTSGTNPDGSKQPKLLSSYDLFSSPEYSGNGYNGFASRLHPSIIGNAIYAGNYNFFNARTATGEFAPKGTGTSNPSDPYFKSKGAVLYKINRNTGKVIWKTVVDSNPQSMISSVGVSEVQRAFLSDLIIIGISSEISGTLGQFPIGLSPTVDPFAGDCCTYRGAVAAIRESDGKLIWKTYTSPKQNVDSLDKIITRGTVNAWTGASVWAGGNFAISYKNRLVYSGNGENFSSSDAADQCEQARIQTGGAPLLSTQCLRVLQDGQVSKADFNDTSFESIAPLVRAPILPHPDSITAYEFDTGKIKWVQSVGGFDVWNASCFAPFTSAFINFSPFCPSYLRSNLGLQFTIKDRDAGNPILIENVKVKGKVRDIVLGITKAALVQAFDAQTGESLWGPVTFGEGGLSGDGFVWAQASDGKRFYGVTGTSSNLTLADYQNPSNPRKVVKGSCDTTGSGNTGFDPQTGIWRGGMYVAVNLSDGLVAWQRCVVGKVLNPTTRMPTGETFAGRSQAPTSVANGIVVVSGATSYIPFAAENPDVYGEVLLLDADTGALLKALPLNVPGQPSGNTLVYQRPIIVGDRIYIANGNKRYDGTVLPKDIYNRVLMYQLSK